MSTYKGLKYDHLATSAQGTLADSAVQPSDNISTLTNDSGYQTAAQVNTAINNLIGAAPGTLDTLAEIATAINNDADVYNTLNTAITAKLDSSAVSAFGLTLIDDADAASARTTLGLGTAATSATTDFATAAQGALADSALQSVAEADVTAHEAALTIAQSQVTGLSTALAGKVDTSSVSTFGGTLIDDVDAAAARTTLGLGTAATTAATDYATAAQGATADSALQELVEDTTPQLGGDLASNSNNIAMADGDQIRFGTGNDMQIEHASAENHIRSNNHTLNIVSDSPVNIKATNGNSIAEFDKNDAVYFYNGTDSSSTCDIDSYGVLSYGNFEISGSGTYIGNGSTLTNLNADNVATGTLATARGGTGLGTIGTAGQVLQVNAGGTALEYATPAAQGLQWQSTIQTSNFTASAMEGYFVDTATTGAVTVTLPASPSVGDEVAVIDAAANAATANITIARNGNRIAGLLEDMTVATDAAAFRLIWTGSSSFGWVLMNK